MRRLDEHGVILARPGDCYRGPRIPLPRQASSVRLGLRHSRGDRVRLRLLVRLGEQVYAATSDDVGGIDGEERSIRYDLPTGFFHARSGFMKRLGESCDATFTVQAELTLLQGRAAAWLTLDEHHAPAPSIAFHSSIALIVADGTLATTTTTTVSYTHAGTTGTDRAAFVGGVALAGNPATTMAVTYGGAAMTQLWLQGDANNKAHGGHVLAATASGAQTVAATFSSQTYASKMLHTTSYTGVHQTVPVGTAVTQAFPATSTPSVTVASINADDLVVDSIFVVTDPVGAPTAGASQTAFAGTGAPVTDPAEFAALSGSSQLGSAGGVMSWTINDYITASLGAIALKASAGAPAGHPAARRIARSTPGLSPWAVRRM